jgi:cell wall-associated NlpC family hydrolase
MNRRCWLLLTLVGCHEPKSVIVHRPEDPKTDQAVTRMWTHEIEGVARDGDWILTRSYYLAADAITLGTGGEGISHASIYDAKRDSVIEAVGSGVREIPLSELIERNHYVIVVRPTGMSARAAASAVQKARTQLGTEFDKAGMLGFDDPEKFYCSELVWWASFGDAPHPRVIEPASLIDHGTVIYWSGKRTDPQVMRIALDHADRGAELHQRGGEPGI